MDPKTVNLVILYAGQIVLIPSVATVSVSVVLSLPLCVLPIAEREELLWAVLRVLLVSLRSVALGFSLWASALSTIIPTTQASGTVVAAETTVASPNFAT